MDRFCFNFIRGIIICANLFVTSLACLLIYISFSAMDQDFGMDTLNDNHPKVVHAYISAISAGVGIITALLSLLGLFGAIRKSESALGMYAAIIFFMVSILAIMVLFTMTMKTNGVTYRVIDKSMVNTTVAMYNHTDVNNVRTRVLDHLQTKLSCCGINSPTDWKDYGTHKIPKSCCSNPVDTDFSLKPPFKYCEQSEFKTGCFKAMTDYFHSNLSTVRLILYAMIGFGLFCSIAACSMVKTLKRSLEVV